MNNLLLKLNNSISIFSNIDNLSQLCKLILEEFISITSINNGIILLQENGKLINCFNTNFPYNIKINRSDYLYDVFKKGKIKIIRKRSFENSDENLKKSSYNVLCVPLVYNLKPIGMMLLFSDKEIVFSQTEILLMQIYANFASMNIKKTKMNSDIKSALDVRDQFISMASHELRTPLTSINGYIQLLYRNLSKKDNPEARWIKELFEESGRLTQLVKVLLDLNRIKQGQFELILNEVNIVDLLNSAIEKFSFANPDYIIEFHNELANSSNRIVGDYNKLLQMVSGLLSNASKFSDPGSMISIELSCNSRYIILKIADNGRGIPKKEIAKIFKAFYKIDHDEKQGMGVGLYFAEHIIRHHKGKIEITSKENKGTIIEIQLPRISI